MKNEKEYTEIRSIKLTKRQKIKLANTDCLHKILSEQLKREGIINAEKEHLWLIGLDFQDYILCIDTIALGNIEAVEVEPMNVFRNAIWKGCKYAILSHNHPSGEINPSEYDINITDRLYQCGLILNIPITDHVIIAPKTYLSFIQSGIMKKIEKSTKYVPPYKLKEMWQKRAEAIRKKTQKKTKKITQINIAKKMLLDNIDIDTIVKYSGLTKEEIGKI